MSSVDSLYDLLEKDNWNLESIQNSLERDSNSINVKNNLGYTPLQSVLKSKNCSVDVVRLFLQKGAYVNGPEGKDAEYSPLMIAIRSSKDDSVIEVLLKKGANVNQVHVSSFNETPLLILLKRANCSIDTVKLLLRYGADVNCMDIYGYSSLATALQNSKDEDIISLLLEKGAGVDTLTNFKRSLLCIAFEHTSNDIVKVLLDAGCSPNACKYHSSALHCATQYTKAGLREDILRRLLEMGVDVNFIDSDGQSVLCFALRNGAKAQDIELLLNEGASLNSCKQHASPLICATGGNKRTPLKAAVMQLLFNRGVHVENEGLEALQSALKYCNYETEAIQLLFELPGMDSFAIDESLLHHAACNPNCKVDVLKLLVKEKSQLEILNAYRETPLHCAVKECKPIIIDFFLKNGSPVHAQNIFDETPLALAVKRARGSKIIKSLLTAGAKLGDGNCWKEGSPSLLAFAFKHYNSGTVDEKVGLKILVKYFFLQNPQSNIQDFMRVSCLELLSFQRQQDFSEYKVFANECLNELQKMESMQVGRGCTLRDLVIERCLPDSTTRDPGVKYYDFCQILKCLTENAFPVFFDNICTGIERPVIENELQKLLVYTNKTCPSLPNTERVFLNYEIIKKIAELLSNDDLTRFILAYRRGLSSNDKMLGATSTSLPK